MASLNYSPVITLPGVFNSLYDIIPHFSATYIAVSIWSPVTILTFTITLLFSSDGSLHPNLIVSIGFLIFALIGSSSPNVPK
jgi:hypothetical protein